VYWCTADVGWITGHSSIVYAPLAHGAAIILYEGAPDYPTIDRWWEIIERYGVSILYTSPTAIRTFMRYGEEVLKIAGHRIGIAELEDAAISYPQITEAAAAGREDPVKGR
jgi:acetyl-CoA synthetase